MKYLGRACGVHPEKLANAVLLDEIVVGIVVGQSAIG